MTAKALNQKQFRNGEFVGQVVTRGVKFHGVYIPKGSRILRVTGNQHKVTVTIHPHRGSTKKGFRYPVTFSMSRDEWNLYEEHCLEAAK